jgi:hypothetical protein
MEPIWQQNDDPDTFDASQPCPDAAHINCDSEMLQFVYNQRNQLDNHISHQLADNGLVDSSTMLGTEDRQDIMLDTDESFPHHHTASPPFRTPYHVKTKTTTYQ